MSQGNVELVRRAWEAFEKGDIATAYANVSPDLVTVVCSPLPVAGTYHGPEGLLRAAIDWAEGFDDLVMTPEEFFDAGDHVVVRSLHSLAALRAVCRWKPTFGTSTRSWPERWCA